MKYVHGLKHAMKSPCRYIAGNEPLDLRKLISNEIIQPIGVTLNPINRAIMHLAHYDIRTTIKQTK